MKNANLYSINYQGLKEKKVNQKLIIFKLLTAAIIIIISSLLFISVFTFISSGENNSDFIRHEIKNGESLWSIAAKYYNSNNIDLRKIIYNIKKLNNLNSSVINPGNEIIIPLN